MRVAITVNMFATTFKFGMVVCTPIVDEDVCSHRSMLEEPVVLYSISRQWTIDCELAD